MDRRLSATQARIAAIALSTEGRSGSSRRGARDRTEPGGGLAEVMTPLRRAARSSRQQASRHPQARLGVGQEATMKASSDGAKEAHELAARMSGDVPAREQHDDAITSKARNRRRARSRRPAARSAAGAAPSRQQGAGDLPRGAIDSCRRCRHTTGSSSASAAASGRRRYSPALRLHGEITEAVSDEGIR